jgi:hypothetical protein
MNHTCSVCLKPLTLCATFSDGNVQYSCNVPSCNPDQYTRKFIICNSVGSLVKESVYLNNNYTVLNYHTKRLTYYTDFFNSKSVDMLLYKHKDLGELASKVLKKVAGASDDQ